MILYRSGQKPTQRQIQRATQTLNVQIEELPERPTFRNRTPRERRKFIEKVERLVRTSKEYKNYIKYIKGHFDMDHCEVLPNVVTGNGKKYTIEIHHEPFQLSWITDTVLHKREDLGEDLSPYLVADEVCRLHYDGVVGLIPLFKTAHELVHSSRIMIPLQFVYQAYDKFVDEYEMWIPDYVVNLVKLKMELSFKSKYIQSDVLLDPTVIYVEVEGFDYPEVPDSWKDALARQRHIEEGTEEASALPTPEEMQGGGLE